MLELTAGALLLSATALLAASRLRIRGTVPFALAAMTIAAALVVAGTLALSAFDAYRPGAMLALEAAALLAVAAWWLAGGRPLPLVAPPPPPAAMWRAARANRTVAVLLAAGGVAAAIELFLGLAVAPNTYDGLMYHLSRAALWIQQGGVFGIDGGTIYETQHQPNGEFLYGWTMLLSGGDALVASVQWLAGIGCGLAVYWGARMLEFPRSAAAFAAAVFYTLPQVVVQASSTFVDLPAALFVGVFALFSLRFIRDRETGDVVVASMALGLAAGVKGTAFLALPGLLLLLWGAVRRWHPPRRTLVTGAAIVAAGALALGSSKYVENLIETGSPQGKAGNDVTRSEPLLASTGQALWTFVDAPGLDGTVVTELLDRGSEYFFDDGRDPGPGSVSEDYVSFGFVGWLLFLPLLAYFALARAQPPARRLTAWAAILFMAFHVLVVETYHFAPHTMLTGVLIGAPLLAWAWGIGWLRHLTALAALAALVPILVQNDKKPLWPSWSPGLTRTEQQGLTTSYAAGLAKADALLAPDARVAVVGPRVLTWDYPLFGPHLDRWIYRVEAYPRRPPTPEQVGRWVDEHDLDAIVWAGVRPPAGAPVEGVGTIAGSRTRIELVQ